MALLSVSMAQGEVVVENARFRLTLGDDAVVQSLRIKADGRELVDPAERIPFASVTQERFYHNEIKLAYPSREVTCRANRVRREGDDLVVGFELVPYEARIGLTVSDAFVGFAVKALPFDAAEYPLDMKLPPVKRLDFLRLPVRNARWFGEWLNVSWDDADALAVVAAEPLTDVANERRNGFRILSAAADESLRIEGATAAIVAAPTPEFLLCLDAFEVAYGLPRGVRDRADSAFASSVWWTGDISMDTVDDHIALAKCGGFSKILVYHKAVCDAPGDYAGIGSYAVNPTRFKGDPANVRAMLGKIHAAGMKAGLHVLHPFIGLDSDYVHPVCDPRLNLKRHFTLARPLDEKESGELFVNESPVSCPTNAKSRVLRFGGELLTYEGFSRERPYRFTGVARGYKKTRPAVHPAGEIGGLLDICEFGGTAAYIDPRTDLQDEIAEKIAKVYNLGFDFFCMDGCEGVAAPYSINVALSQYRVWKRLEPKPLFTEGAAKAHFAWHHLSGANAFDAFEPERFKKMIVRWPLHEAEMMRQDFSRVSFGWWSFKLPDGEKAMGTQPDLWEFGTSRAAAWDSPTTVLASSALYPKHPRIDDLLETMRRWEDVRRRRWLTPAQKAALKSPTRQHHLYLNERGEYELHEIEMLVPEVSTGLRAFLFERDGKRVVAYWHTSGEGDFTLPFGTGGEGVTLHAAGIKYYETDLPREKVRAVFSSLFH